MGVVASWLVMGLIAYAAGRRYRNGSGLGPAIIWFCWTNLWVGVLAALASAPFGATGGLAVYLAYACLRIYDLSQEKQATEFFTRQCGSLTRYRVTYMGGHRTSGVRGVLLISQAGLIMVNKYRASANTLCMIPIDRIMRAESMGVSDRIVAWSSDLPVPMTFTGSEQGTLVVQFANDVNDASTVSFRVGNGKVAAHLKHQVDYAVYDWKLATVGGRQSI